MFFNLNVIIIIRYYLIILSFILHSLKTIITINILTPYLLVDVKNKGGLIKSSLNVIKIVRFIENTLIRLTSGLSILNISGLSNKIILAVKNYVYSYNIFKDLNCLNDSFLEKHKLNLVTLISKQYLKIRLHHLSNLKTICNVSKRRLLTKLIIFNHQYTNNCISVLLFY